MRDVIRNLGIVVRTLRRSPGFAVAAILTLALGIGANITIFSVVNSVLLRPLPYEHPEQLAMIWNHYGAGGQSLPAVSAPDARDYQQRAQLFEGFAVASNGSSELGLPESPQQVDTAFVSADFFPLLGVKPLLGRSFEPGEAILNGPAVVMLTYDAWQRRFAGDPQIIGKSITIGRVPTAVVGVLPASFALELPPEKFMTDSAEIYRPLQINVDAVPRNLTGMTVIGRIKPGVAWAQAQAEMDTIAAQLRSEHAVHQSSGMTIGVVPLKHDVTKRARLPLLAMMASVCFVLLIACGNVANLLLARATGRRRELALRAALGASRLDLALLIFSEGLVVAIAGALLGLGLAFAAIRGLIALHPANLPRLAELTLGPESLAYAAAVACLTALLFSLAPALLSARMNLNEELVQGGRPAIGSARNRYGRWLIAGQVALSVVILVTCALLLRSFAELQRVHPGFESHNVLTFGVNLPVVPYPTPDAIRKTHRAIQQNLRSLPGVQAVGATLKVPLTGSGPQTPYAWDDRTAQQWESISADNRIVLPGYFESLGIQFISGNPFTDADDENHAGVVIVDEMLAQRAWGTTDAVGKKLLVDDPSQPHQWLTVIGVVKHARMHEISLNLREQVYLSALQRPARQMFYTIRTQGDPEALLPAAIAAVHQVDPALAVYQRHSMDYFVSQAMAQTRFVLLLAAIFGGVALLLTAIGIFGLTSYFTSLRTREFGIRVALGAQRGSIYALILREGVMPAVAGATAGVAVALILAPAIRSLLYGVNPRDPMILIVAPTLLIVVASLAVALPARKAVRVDPMISLRAE